MPRTTKAPKAPCLRITDLRKLLGVDRSHTFGYDLRICQRRHFPKNPQRLYQPWVWKKDQEILKEMTELFLDRHGKEYWSSDPPRANPHDTLIYETVKKLMFLTCRGRYQNWKRKDSRTPTGPQSTLSTTIKNDASTGTSLKRCQTNIDDKSEELDIPQEESNYEFATSYPLPDGPYYPNHCYKPFYQDRKRAVDLDNGSTRFDRDYFGYYLVRAQNAGTCSAGSAVSPPACKMLQDI